MAKDRSQGDDTGLPTQAHAAFHPTGPTRALGPTPNPPPTAGRPGPDRAVGPGLTPTTPTPDEPVPRTPRRYRVLPRTVLGLSSLILAFAIGAGFSGVVLYSYYQYHLDQTNSRVNALVNGYKKDFANAEGDLQATSAQAQKQIQSQLAPLQQAQGGPATLTNLVKQLGPSLFFVHTLDQNGQPSVGTAFVVSSNANQSLLLTSYATIQAATHSPSPAVYVRQGTTDTQVTVSTWDTQYDLALIILPRGGLPVIKPAPASPAPQIGQHLYAMSGLGTAGASISQGTVADVSSTGIEHDAAINASYQGGPLVTSSGQVVAVASQTYAPEGFVASGMWYAPFVTSACAKVLHCPSGTLPGSS